ncbi:MAG: tetratricopeptide repeat protein [Saccharothrix sp.]|nr:tetratricopeptide repeat protein [Saccharothrix sp.]
MTAEFGVLGLVEARIDGRPVELGHARQRWVLAVLLVEANQWLSTDQLIDRVWGDRVPRGGRKTLYSYLSHLRRALRPTAEVDIVQRTGGYELVVDEGAVDLHRFRRLLADARDTDDDRAAVLYTQALALWRGDLCPGLDTPWMHTVRAGLDRQRLAAELDYADLRLRLGRHTDLLTDLPALAAAHPLNERLAGQLMLALYRNGHQAEALDHYQLLRTRLAEELGTDPSPDLRELHQRILAVDPTLSVLAAQASRPPVPRQLPAAPVLFTGRVRELAELHHALTTVPNTTAQSDGSSTGSSGLLAAVPTQSPVMISVIGGTGGIGKTWLALAWAHQHADRFPDGQLFADLHGFSPDNEPVDAAAALHRFLEALGVPSDRVPASLEARSALYRSLLAGRRTLIMLDNAATVEQVAPLLPGGGPCTVLITSRHRLPGLVARHGARPVSLGVLSDAESRALLVAAMGADRVNTDGSAADELIALCGGLPLALGLLAARAHPHLPLADMVEELHESALDPLDDASDSAANLSAVLSWSLGHLTEQQRTVFALLGVAPGPDISLPAAAGLAGLPVRETRVVLRTLADVFLIEARPGGRYAMHDLVRAYATTLAHNLPEPVRLSALQRVITFYLHTALAAARHLEPNGGTIQLDPLTPSVSVHALSDQAAAMAWLDIEHSHLLAAQRVAAAHQWHRIVWQLAWVLASFHTRRGHRHDDVAVWRAAADAASHLPDPTIRTRAHRSLGRAYTRLGEHGQATEHLHRALTLAEQHHSTTEQGITHRALALAREQQDDDARALEHARKALDLFRSVDEPVWEADTLNAVGWYTARLGDHDTARELCQASLALHRAHHDPLGEAETLGSLGYIDNRTDRHHQAIQNYRQSLDLYRTLGHTYEIATILDRLGSPLTALGQHDQARAAWREALTLYRQQGREADIEHVQRQLDNLDTH